MLAADDASFVAALELALDRLHEIEIVGLARDGADAIALFAETRPDVALVDLAMPHGDGVEVTNHIRRLDRDANVVILSAEEDSRTIARCFDAGARGCLRKSQRLLDYVPIALAAAGVFDAANRRGQS
jgi:two-component system chemotaxis response regulator CheY